jgi:segregation and condensation protein B
MEQDFNEQDIPQEENQQEIFDETASAGESSSKLEDQNDVPVEEDTHEPDYNAENEDMSQPPVAELGRYPEGEPDESVSATYSSDEKLAELEKEIDEAVEQADEEEAGESTETISEAASENEEYTQDESPTPATSLTRDQIVEAVLFSSDGPLPASKVASVIGAVSSKEIREIVDRLNCNYGQWNCSFRIEEIAGGFQMMTCPEYATYLQQLYKVRSESKLSAAALETLAVVAYKQPVLRAEIEAIRGVAGGEMIRQLMEKDLIKIVGRAEELGRPMLYGTTKRFLQVFGLGSLEDLPKVPELLPPTRTVKPEGEKQEEKPQESPAASEPEKSPAVETASETESTSTPPSDEIAQPVDEPTPEYEDTITPASESEDTQHAEPSDLPTGDGENQQI